ncbi:MAG TPA: GNAT family N-acetyltransferase [Thermoanaerobaculia bacterium]|jgi:ribosomal protein S18 acetylase RimI-like enzyme
MNRERITFRPETDADADLLYQLYSSTREEEMKMVPWNDAEKEGFLRQQFQAQTAHYKQNYADAEYLIIQLDGLPVGRLYLHDSAADLRIMEILLAPSQRGSGIGTMLIREILERARSAGKIVSIHVEHFNPAVQLYERLGFKRKDSYGVYYLYEWSGDA